jgi:phospholipid/cholesterol/gamma-HCH transport system permease protein
MGSIDFMTGIKAFQVRALLWSLGWSLRVLERLTAMVALIGQLIIDLGYLVRNPARMPWREISATIYRSGAQALPITALLGFLVGVVLSYLSARELQSFGAELYIVNILGVGVVRELGGLLAAILVAGRSGSSMTAQLGVMRITEELDALSVMGISTTVRLVLPKLIALAVALPLLVLWTDALALAGGMLAADLRFHIGYRQFLAMLPAAVPIANLWLGLGKGVVFGILIGLIASYHGLRIKPNSESLGAGTTSSVVSAITTVIIVDALAAVVFADVGMRYA